MTALSVNLNKIALLRNSRGMDFPNVVNFAKLCIRYGADGITIHPRPDQRHATYQDVKDLSRLCNQHPHVEFNIEGYPTADFLKVVKDAKPDQCTLVPDAPDQITSDHGWDTRSESHFLRSIIANLKGHGIRTSVFLDPDPEMIASASECGTDRIELYTEEYAKCYGSEKHRNTFRKYADTASAAQLAGLGVNAGHDLNQQNLGTFLTIPGIVEVSIGHALTVEALLNGYESTIRAYVSIVRAAKSANA